MTATATAISVTSKLYETRDAMKFLFGENYEGFVKPIITQLQDLSQKWQCSELEAMTRACNEMSARGESGVDIALVIAAYVEDVEGAFDESKKAEAI